MCSIAGYGQMIADEGRMRAYSRALQAAISRDSIVLDIGAGTGILSLLACQYGARKVYAVEPSSAIGVAQQAAHANGFADRIECIQALSTEIILREKADVIVSGLRAYCAFRATPSLNYRRAPSPARTRRESHSQTECTLGGGWQSASAVRSVDQAMAAGTL